MFLNKRFLQFLKIVLKLVLKMFPWKKKDSNLVNLVQLF